MKQSEFITESHAARILSEVKHFRDYKSGGRWRAALSDDPDTLALHGSKTRSTSRSWTPAMAELRRTLEQHTGKKFNFCLINHYDDAKGIAYHSDNLRNSVHGTIASVSIGATRTFRVRHKLTGTVTDIPLRHRDLFVFDEQWNADHWHGIPVEKNAAYRCNLTFRCVSERIVREPPEKLFNVSEDEVKKIMDEFGVQFIAPKDLEIGDVALKRWGSAGKLRIVKSRKDIAELQMNRMGKSALQLTDLYIRCDRNTLRRIQSIVCPMLKQYFPSGPMFTPVPITHNQCLGILRDGFIRCGYTVKEASSLRVPISVSASVSSPFISNAYRGMNALKLHYPFSRYLLGGLPGFEQYPRKSIETRSHIQFDLSGKKFAIVETQGKTKYGKENIRGTGARIIGTVMFAEERIFYGCQAHLDADEKKHLLSSTTTIEGYEFENFQCCFLKTTGRRTKRARKEE